MKKKDVILIASILIIGILGMFATQAVNNENSGKTAIIYIDSQEVDRIPIDSVKGEKTFSFQFGENTGYLEVKDGAVRMKEMDLRVCPERVCSDTGWISKSYESIVCLPNRIVVNIENGDAANGDSNLVDNVSY